MTLPNSLNTEQRSKAVVSTQLVNLVPGPDKDGNNARFAAPSQHAHNMYREPINEDGAFRVETCATIDATLCADRQHTPRSTTGSGKS